MPDQEHIEGARKVRAAGSEQDDALGIALARAFQSDPALSWILPDADNRARRLPAFFAWALGDHRRNGLILASPRGEVAALWRLPGKVHYHDPMTPAELWRFWRILGGGLVRGDTVGRAIARHVPRGEDYVYLKYVGVAPEAQGKGWGGTVIRAGVAHANALGVATCLETATPENVALYRNLGFEVAEEWDVRGGGPHFWTMVRPCD